MVAANHMNHDVAEVNGSDPPMLPGAFLYEKEPGYEVVSEPDPRKIEKEGLAHRLGWKCTLRNVRNLVIAELCKACRVFC